MKREEGVLAALFKRIATPFYPLYTKIAKKIEL